MQITSEFYFFPSCSFLHIKEQKKAGVLLEHGTMKRKIISWFRFYQVAFSAFISSVIHFIRNGTNPGKTTSFLLSLDTQNPHTYYCI